MGGGVGKGGCKSIFFRRGAGHSGMYRLRIRWCREPWSDTAIDQLVAGWKDALLVFRTDRSFLPGPAASWADPSRSSARGIEIKCPRKILFRRAHDLSLIHI